MDERVRVRGGLLLAATARGDICREDVMEGTEKRRPNEGRDEMEEVEEASDRLVKGYAPNVGEVTEEDETDCGEDEGQEKALMEDTGDADGREANEAYERMRLLSASLSSLWDRGVAGCDGVSGGGEGIAYGLFTTVTWPPRAANAAALRARTTDGKVNCMRAEGSGGPKAGGAWEVGATAALLWPERGRRRLCFLVADGRELMNA